VLTVTRAVEVAEPPVPLAVMVYVVNRARHLGGASGFTVPTQGDGSCVAWWKSSSM